MVYEDQTDQTIHIHIHIHIHKNIHILMHIHNFSSSSSSSSSSSPLLPLSSLPLPSINIYIFHIYFCIFLSFRKSNHRQFKWEFETSSSSLLSPVVPILVLKPSHKHELLKPYSENLCGGDAFVKAIDAFVLLESKSLRRFEQ